MSGMCDERVFARWFVEFALWYIQVYDSRDRVHSIVYEQHSVLQIRYSCELLIAPSQAIFMHSNNSNYRKVTQHQSS